MGKPGPRKVPRVVQGELLLGVVEDTDQSTPAVDHQQGGIVLKVAPTVGHHHHLEIGQKARGLRCVRAPREAPHGRVGPQPRRVGSQVPTWSRPSKLIDSSLTRPAAASCRGPSASVACICWYTLPSDRHTVWQRV